MVFLVRMCHGVVDDVRNVVVDDPVQHRTPLPVCANRADLAQSTQVLGRQRL